MGVLCAQAGVFSTVNVRCAIKIKIPAQQPEQQDASSNWWCECNQEHLVLGGLPWWLVPIT